MGSSSDEPRATSSHYSQYLPDLTQPRFTSMAKQTCTEYADDFKQHGRPPWLHALWLHWRELYAERYKGISTDGHIIPNLFPLQDEGMPIEEITAAAHALLALLDEDQKRVLCYHIDAPEWRSWSNPEFLLSDKGLRLERVSPAIRAATMTVLRTTLSPEGYAKAVGAMRINGFLGELCGCAAICNEGSYNFVLFATPSTTRPWGVSFYGHHLCLNVFLHRSQVVVSPCFTGAEPNEIDRGPYAGTRILHEEGRLGLLLMRSLPRDLQAQAQVYRRMRDPAMPPGRWNHDDQRHLAGAFRDNRVIPYEGVCVSQMTPSTTPATTTTTTTSEQPQPQQALILAILEQFLLYLPLKARQLKLNQCRAHFATTYFSWIGPYNNNSSTDTASEDDGEDEEEVAFYYRIQSPVILVEFDHHSGVFLTNPHPARFHVHTVLRTPNAGDYGMALLPLVDGLDQRAWVWEEEDVVDDVEVRGTGDGKGKGKGEEESDEWAFRENQ